MVCGRCVFVSRTCGGVRRSLGSPMSFLYSNVEIFPPEDPLRVAFGQDKELN